MNEKLNLLEKAIIKAILKSNNNETSKKLYKQYQIATVKKRTYTGVGFYTDFYISDKDKDIFISREQIKLGGVYADIKGLKFGAGFILFVKDGRLKTLEGYTYNEKWPQFAQIDKIFIVQNNGNLTLYNDWSINE